LPEVGHHHLVEGGQVERLSGESRHGEKIADLGDRERGKEEQGRGSCVTLGDKGFDLAGGQP
jgi:hypothetical protein